MTMHFRELAELAVADGAVSPDEVLSLRREGWGDGRIGADEAEAMFALNNRVGERSSEWVDAFAEALVDYMIAGGNPRGYVTGQQADWLVSQIDRDGRLESLAELEMLARLFERADHVPDSLKAYALHQIEQAVLTGEGPTREGGKLEAGKVTEAECRLLRRYIFSSGSERPGAVSQGEAEMLFRIKDATLGATNAPEWPLLFVQGVGNYLQGWSAGHDMQPERARQLEAFMNDTTPSIGRFMGRMATTKGFGMVADRVLGFGRKGIAQSSLACEVAAAQAITGNENDWLQGRFGADGRMDELEHALVVFLSEEAVRPGV